MRWRVAHLLLLLCVAQLPVQRCMSSHIVLFLLMPVEQYNDLGYGVHLHGFDGTLLLPKDYDHLAETQFAAPSINNIYMERLKPCS